MRFSQRSQLRSNQSLNLLLKKKERCVIISPNTSINKQAKGHILIIDDDRSVTQMLTFLLEEGGYSVEVACSSQEAFSRIGPQTDLILLDLVLSDENGFEICRRLKKNVSTRHIPVIVLSANLLSDQMREKLYLGADDYLTKPFDFKDLMSRMHDVIRRGEAFRANYYDLNQKEKIVNELRRIIKNDLIVPYFQPIYSVEPLALFGCEVLTRIEGESFLSNPEFLFKAALEYGYYLELEQLVWRKAIDYLNKKSYDYYVFLNCDPHLIEGAKVEIIRDICDGKLVTEKKIVLEITERSSISDFTVFYRHLNKYRETGFKFAVDDVGGGYASLESIIEINPEIVKIDRNMITGLHDDKFKRSIVKFIIGFCRENNITAIAEGIETRREFEVLLELGVNAVQGYYLAKPMRDIDVNQIYQNIRMLK